MPPLHASASSPEPENPSPPADRSNTDPLAREDPTGEHKNPETPAAPQELVLEHLEAIDYRNFDHLQARFAPHLNVISGENGQGKTNLVEAIGFLLELDSFRGQRGQMLIRDGCSVARLEGLLRWGNTEYPLRVIIHSQGRRVWCDDTLVKRLSEHIGLATTRVFNPEHLYRFRRDGSERRQLLDRCLGQQDPQYAQALIRWRKIWTQRNSALRRGELNALDAWDTLFSEACATVSTGRTHLVQALSPHLAALDAVFSNPEREGTLQLIYRPSLGSDLAQNLAKLRTKRRIETQLGHTLYGSQRDQLFLQRQRSGNSADARSDTRPDTRPDTRFSQGEYRLAFLCLKLALSEWMAASQGVRPLLILDDLFSELDPRRQTLLMRYLQGREQQIFITHADPQIRHCWSQARSFSMHNGTLQTETQHARSQHAELQHTRSQHVAGSHRGPARDDVASIGWSHRERSHTEAVHAEPVCTPQRRTPHSSMNHVLAAL